MKRICVQQQKMKQGVRSPDSGTPPSLDVFSWNRKALKMRKPGTLRKNTLWKNTLGKNALWKNTHWKSKSELDHSKNIFFGFVCRQLTTGPIVQKLLCPLTKYICYDFMIFMIDECGCLWLPGSTGTAGEAGDGSGRHSPTWCSLS